MVPGDLNNDHIKRRHALPIYFTRARHKVGRPPVHPQVSQFWSYNQLQKYLRHCTVFWHKWPVHELVLVIPPPPLIKAASNTRPCSKLGGTTLDGREEGGQYYISLTCDQEWLEARKVVFSWECLNIFATGCSFQPISPGLGVFQGQSNSPSLIIISLITIPRDKYNTMLWL